MYVNLPMIAGIVAIVYVLWVKVLPILLQGGFY